MSHTEHCISSNRFGDGFDCVCASPPGSPGTLPAAGGRRPAKPADPHDWPLGEASERAFSYFAVQLNEAESGFACVSGPHATPQIANAAVRGMVEAQLRGGGLARKHAVLMVANGGVLNIETARAVAQ